MMHALHEMWMARSARERVMLGGLALLLLGVGYVYLALFPAIELRDRALARLTDARKAETEVRQLLPSLARKNDTAGTVPGEPLNDRLAQLAAAAALQLTRFEPEADGGASITIENVQSVAALQWLASLEREHGLKIRRLTIEPSSTGFVTLQASLIERK